MKKKLFALILAAAMVVGMLPAASAASDYADVIGRWSQREVEDMTARGLYNGYTDGLFHPEDPLTTGQTLAICVRMSAYDKEMIAAAAEDNLEAVEAVADSTLDYFFEDFAVAVAAGIVSVEELEKLTESGKLASGITREEFSEFLVRALQINVPDEAPELPFLDLNDISTEYLIPVYLLYANGIVKGEPAKDKEGFFNFNPKKIISREESAAMFSRAVAFADEKALIIELYDYATYGVKAGRIVSYDDETRALVIDNAIIGELEVTVPKTADIFEGNAVSGSNSLEAGRYARVCSNATGVFAVRVYDGTETVYTGELREYDGETVTFHTGIRTISLPLDRETVISAGGKTGGKEVFDDRAGYSAITAAVDPTGRMTALRFEGGSHAESMFLTSVGTDGTIGVATHGGVPGTMKLAADAEIKLPDDVKTLGSACVGKRLDLRVDNITGEIVKLEVDSTNTYVHGGFVRTMIRSSSRTITIENVNTGETTGYKLSAEATVEIEGAAKAIGDLVAGQYVTMVVGDKETITAIEAFPGSSTFTGELTSISYGKTISFTLESEDGVVKEYSFESGKVPQLKRGNRVITADKLREGDELTVNEKYSKITLITVAIVEADLTAVVEGISISTGGTTIDLKLDETGETATYPLSATAEILGTDGKPTTLTAIQGMKVAVILSGDAIVSIEIKGAAAQSGELVGEVQFVNSTERTLLVKLENGTMMTISVPYGATVLTVTGGSASFGSLEAEDIVTIYGEFNTDGAFTATIVIKK